MAPGEGPLLAAVGEPVVAPGAVDGGATPTPKANEPVARCPSTAETVRHATVYMPGPTGMSGTLSCRGSPDIAC